MKKAKNTLMVLSISSLTTFNISYADKISVEFNNAKLSTVVDAISQASNINVIWDKDAIAQKDKLVYVSIKKYYDSDKILNLILNENGLIIVKEGDIYKIKVADKYFVSGFSKATKEKIETKCFYTRSLEPGEILMNIRDNYLSENGTVVFKPKETTEVTTTTPATSSSSANTSSSNTSSPSATSKSATTISLPKICITDKPEIIEKIKYKFSDYLLDRPYQISIEARIVQIESRSLKDLGIQWGGLASNIDNNNTKIIAGTGSPSGLARFRTGSSYAVDFPATITTPGGFSVGFIFGGIQNFLDVRLSALQKVGKSKILSKPQVVTMDGETAEISQGFEIPYTTAVAAGAGTISSVSFKKAALGLKVTPITTADGNIIMDVTITQDIPDFKNLVLGTPPIQTKTVKSKIVAKDGTIVAIGGILEKTEDEQQTGVPGLMNIPILGSLFRQNFNQVSNRELIIFLSPKIVYE